MRNKQLGLRLSNDVPQQVVNTQLHLCIACRDLQAACQAIVLRGSRQSDQQALHVFGGELSDDKNHHRRH